MPSALLLLRRFTLLALACVALAGCGAASTTPLPDIKAPPRPLLSADQQKEAISDLERRKAELDKATARTSKPAR